MEYSRVKAGARIQIPRRRGQAGVTSIEYALIASLIAVFIVGAVSATRVNVLGLYVYVTDKVTCAVSRNCQ